MNKLNVVQYYPEQTEFRPYRRHSVGDKCTAASSGLSGLFANYYPRARRYALVESYDDNNYTIIPDGYTDKIVVGHCDIRPIDIVESRFFAPAHILLPGVLVKLRNGSIRSIKESDGHVVLDDGSVIHKDMPLRIMRRVDDSTRITSFLRG